MQEKSLNKKLIIPIIVIVSIVILFYAASWFGIVQLSSLKNLVAVDSKKSYIKNKFDIAEALFRFGDEKYHESQLILESILQEEPDEITVYPFLGAIYSYRTEYGKLISLLNQALSYFPDDEMVIVNLGKSYYEAGNYRSSLKIWEKKKDNLNIRELIDVVNRNKEVLK